MCLYARALFGFIMSAEPCLAAVCSQKLHGWRDILGSADNRLIVGKNDEALYSLSASYKCKGALSKLHRVQI